MIEEFAEFVQKRPKAIIIALLLITAFFLIPLSRIEVDTSVKVFMPKNILVPLEKVRSLAGNPSYHIIFLIGKNHESMLSVEALKEQLELTDFLRNNFEVETISTAEIIEKELNENYNKSLTEVKSEEELGEAVYGLFEKSPTDFQSLVLSMLDEDYDTSAFTDIGLLQKFSSLIPFSFYGTTPKKIKLPYTTQSHIYITTKKLNVSEDEQEQTSIMLREKVDELNFEHIKAVHRSEFLIGHDIDQKIAGSTTFLIVMTLISMSLLIFLSFRRFYFVFIPLFIIAIAIVWTFGTAVMLGLKITPIHPFVIALLVGIALDGPLHITKRFLELRAKKEYIYPLKETLSSMLPALSLTSLTTAGAFVAQLILPSPPALLSFALVVIIGVIYSFVLVLLLWPALMAVKSIPDVLNSGKTVKKMMNWTFKTSIKHSKIIITILMAFVLASIYNVDKIETDSSADMIIPEGTPTKEAERIAELYSSQFGVEFILIEGNVLQPEILAALDRLEENIQDNEFFERRGNRVKFESVNTVLRTFNASNTTDLEKIYDELHESTAIAKPITKTTFSEMAQSVLPKNGSDRYSHILAIVKVKNENVPQILQSYDELTEDIEQSGLKDIQGISVEAAGTGFSLAQSELFIRKLQIVSSILMFAFVFLVLLLIYRNLALSIIVSTPIFIGSVLSLGLMPLLKIPLTFLSAIVIPLTIGLGIDYSIYITQRYKEELKKHDNKEAARLALEQTGEGNWLAAITTSLGFFIIGFSFLPMAQSFGILTAITIMLTFLTTIFLLPVLLIRFVKE